MPEPRSLAGLDRQAINENRSYVRGDAAVCLVHGKRREWPCVLLSRHRQERRDDLCASQAPFGSMVTVSYGGKSIRCRVNDRGPFIRGRIIDVSTTAARALGILQLGVAHVVIE
ncbi:septal ring lytic transglycosylase RlpA family protein [Bradyrhizobium sp. 2S1]|uniref:septal ring lytic transglycosylase RlpA family protein n=1 Tax=Bradyrhizobium sp. 2S1 TaxID=1404429 RepID=UPI00289F5AA3|nr:septal ring lytic transglycosylase RlpA family protein [Bradyrhizobium sp. 2S1]